MVMHLDRLAGLYYKHLLELLETNKDLEKTIKGILKHTAWAAGGACVGGIVLGLPGALAGGIAGNLLGYFKSDAYSSMLTVIRNMSDADKAKLVAAVQELIGSSSIESLKAYILSKVHREALIDTILSVLPSKSG